MINFHNDCTNLPNLSVNHINQNLVGQIMRMMSISVGMKILLSKDDDHDDEEEDDKVQSLASIELI